MRIILLIGLLLTCIDASSRAENDQPSVAEASLDDTTTFIREKLNVFGGYYYDGQHTYTSTKGDYRVLYHETVSEHVTGISKGCRLD